MDTYYHVERCDDGLCNVTIYGDINVYECEYADEYDVEEYTLYSVPYYPGIECNIREHFEAWKAHAIAFTAQRDAMMRALCASALPAR
jgi:hypothetical protein